ncbi:membrane protein insertion efficiency factor YidD [Moellerella wisconsensis]
MRDSCRYNPTCSEYAILAIQKYGVFKGWSMTIKRIKKCKPPFGGNDFP